MQKASYSEATDLRKENARPKELVAETARENRLLRGMRARTHEGTALPPDDAAQDRVLSKKYDPKV
jgi:hypothetical protein